MNSLVGVSGSAILFVIAFSRSIIVESQSGPFGSDAVSEGPCEITTSQSLFNTNVIWLLNLDLGHWYAPVGSSHFFRSIYEAFHGGHSANNQSDLDAWNLDLTYIVNFEWWKLYNKVGYNFCFLWPGSPLTGIPIFHCGLAVHGSERSSFPHLFTIQNFTIVWTDSVSNMLTYRCQNGQRDWVHWTKMTTKVNTTVLKKKVLPIIKNLGFNMSNIEYMRY